MIVNVVMKKLFRIIKLRKFGRNHFNPTPSSIQVPASKWDGPVNISLYTGYSAAVESTLSGLSFNVDVVHRIVRAETVRQVMDAIEEKVALAKRVVRDAFHCRCTLIVVICPKSNNMNKSRNECTLRYRADLC
jgi:hypothetical protein